MESYGANRGELDLGVVLAEETMGPDQLVVADDEMVGSGREPPDAQLQQSEPGDDETRNLDDPRVERLGQGNRDQCRTHEGEQDPRQQQDDHQWGRKRTNPQHRGMSVVMNLGHRHLLSLRLEDRSTCLVSAPRTT